MIAQGLPKGYIDLAFDKIIRQTDKAQLIDFGNNEVWIPDSQIDDIFEDTTGNTIILSEWIAKQKGLI